VKQIIHKNWINVAVFSIILLIMLNVFITHTNHRIMEENRLLQRQAEQIKVTVSQFAIGIIHNLDLGLRGYALFRDDKYLYPMRFALRDKDSLFHSVGALLASQHYPMVEFYRLKDSTDAYAEQCVYMKQLFDEKNMDEFYRLADLDKGYKLWLQYEKVSEAIYRFENAINNDALEKYHAAQWNTYLVQLILFLVCVPTLIFTAIHTHQELSAQMKLRESEADKALILAQQNEMLEHTVLERTQEIQLQNRELQKKQGEITAQNEELKSQQEEISLQRDQLAQQNQHLSEAQHTILLQHETILKRNDSLEEEIRKRTHELMEYNQQLEQFAFIAAHNLRAPAARILGLGKLLELSISKEEEQMIIQKLICSTAEMDTVIKDLNVILEVKSNDSKYLTQVDLHDELLLICSNLEKEILETQTLIHESFEAAPVVIAVKAYIDSILFNLISNAIKYRSPDRAPIIRIKTTRTDDYICLSITDNGLGFDTQQHQQNLFTLYKRFHFHVEGKGMGLYLVKTQVSAMDGKIEVESNINEGTTFRIYLKERSAVHPPILQPV